MNKKGGMKINGLPVVDATESVTLRVKALDIGHAKRKSPSRCAAAVACKRQFHASDARVHMGRTYIRFGRKWRRYLTSSALRDEIVAIDRGGTFRPGEFTLIKMQPSRMHDTGRRRRRIKRRVARQPKRSILADVRPIGIYA